MRAGHAVLMKVGDDSQLIVVDPLGILGLQFRLQFIHLINIIITKLITFKLYFKPKSCKILAGIFIIVKKNELSQVSMTMITKVI